MKPFTESMRYEYPLTRDSVVLDVGCHKGTFSKIISEKYGCKILAFEPIKQFYEQAKEVLKENSNVELFNCGVGASCRKETFCVKGDSSGEFADSETSEEVYLTRFAAIIYERQLTSIDLLKINIEGGEFELLEHMIERGLITHFKNIQVQFHPVVPDYEKRYQAIREALLKTHRLTYDAPWCWENYERI